MANLQEELQRFLTARFGADVRDAFVSCIEKIHAENLDVAALDASMQASAKEVAEAKAQMEQDLTRTEEKIRAIAEGANSTAADAAQTANDAKTIARTAEVTAGEALAAAKNAKDESANAAGDAELAMSAAQDVKQGFSNLELLLSGKVDGAFVEAGYLYLTSNNEVVAGPLGPFSGSGGGGSSGNNAILSVSNASGWLSRSVAYGRECLISLNWSSLEDELPTGSGVMKISVNGVTKAMLDIAQGVVTQDIGKYLSVGSNAVKVTVSDVYGNSRTTNFSVNAIDISIRSTFDASSPFTGNISFSYVPVGNVMKRVHLVLDGKELDTVNTSSSGRQLTYTIPAQSHGAHTLEAYFDAEVNGQTVESNHLYYELICIESLNTTPIIVSSFHEDTVAQYTSLTIPYSVYDPESLTAEVVLSANGAEVSRQTVDRSRQVWTYRADNAGALALEISCGAASKTISLTVTASEVEVEAETENLALYLSSYGRSNKEENPGSWSYGDINTVFSGFNFSSDGWQLDEDNTTVLRVAGDARLDIPLRPFAKDCRASGKTIEVEFATRDVMDYDAVVLSCMSGGRGFTLTPQKTVFQSEQTEIFTQYKENEHVRLTFVIEKKAENRLVYCYINGVMSGVAQYPADDDFSQTSPVSISVGSNDAAIDLYCIRVYDNDLTRHQVLTNWIADTQVIEELLSRYSRNSVFDAYSNIVISQLPKDLPYLVLTGAELPQYKGDKKTLSGYYTDPVDSARSFTFENAQADVQGTSSQYYARKNYKIKFKGGFVAADGSTAENYPLRPDAIPTDTFTFKADVASSEGANNVELVRLYNDACPYRTAPQKANPAVRQGIDGFPIVLFWNDGEKTTFLGKYNFNNDKGTEEVYGFAECDESWEILNNTGSRVLWKSDDFTGEDWRNDFESRYPDENTDSSNLSSLAAWLAGTDQSAATGEALPAARTYDGVKFTEDTKEYRLAKFRAEFDQHLEKQPVLFYYLFTELFLMVDSRAKNMFPTFMGGSKWFSLPYDFDTALGINNEGTLAFSYNLEDIDQTESGADVFNGQQSVLWVNLRQAFYDELQSMYRSLRSTGALSYADTERRFEEHQSKWPEAIFNEDAYFKYLAPLVENNTAAYLAMLQGSKAAQRRWWLYNRFRYLDSKYNAGDALSDVITLRGYAKADITLTPYADVYVSVKYGSYLVQQRASRNKAYPLACPLDNVNDTEIYIYSASQLKDVGDLSGLKVGYADFSNAIRLQALKIGDAGADYSNSNLTELHLGNNTLLRTLDVRNCPNLRQTVDVSGCSNIEHIYFDGTAVTGVTLPNGGILKTLRLPGTVTNLTVRNQTAVTDFAIGGCGNLSTLRLENVSAAFDQKAILDTVPAGARVRLIGFHWEADSAEDILALYDRLDTMRGLDENGSNMDRAQISGTIRVDALTGAQYEEMLTRYPNVAIRYTTLTSNLFYYDDTGETLLHTESITNGGDGKYSGRPGKSSTAQYSYAFKGWSGTPGGAVESSCRKSVVFDRKVYAVYTATVRTYTVSFYNGDTLLQTVENVPYGSSAAYTGETPVDPDYNMPFESWDPSPQNITGTTNCRAVFQSAYALAEISDSWEDILAAIDDGSYRKKYMVGNYKPLDMGTEGVLNMQIAAIDKDVTSAGDAVPLSFISMQLMTTKRSMNANGLKTDTEDSSRYVEGTGSIGGWEKSKLRQTLSGSVLPLVPAVVADRIIAVRKTQPYLDTSCVYHTDQVTEDKLWLPSRDELVGIYKYAFPESNYQKFLPDDETRQIWWLRSASSTTYPSSVGRQFEYVYYSGNINEASYNSYGDARSAYSVPLCFCLGKSAI